MSQRQGQLALSYKGTRNTGGEKVERSPHSVLGQSLAAEPGQSAQITQGHQQRNVAREKTVRQHNGTPMTSAVHQNRPALTTEVRQRNTISVGYKDAGMSVGGVRQVPGVR